MQIKICGLRRAQDIEWVNRLRPEYAGFVFAPGRRQVTVPLAAELAARLDVSVTAVGVFVDTLPHAVAEAARVCRLGAVQLHGAEDAGYIASLRPLLPVGCRVWKAARVRGAADLTAVWRVPCDMVLLDAFSPCVAGGSGHSFDWGLLAGARTWRTCFLAGGLNAKNVARAVRTVRPLGVDVSSGVETDGVKDGGKMAAFIAAARAAAAGVGL